MSREFVTARSRIPSPLKSPVAIPAGAFPTRTGVPVGCVKVPSPLPNRMFRLLLKPLVTAKSSFPSPLKSPATSPARPSPRSVAPEAGVKVPSPLPSKTAAAAELAETENSKSAKSCFPSPLKSPTKIQPTAFPIGIGDPGAGMNVPSPLPSKMSIVP